MKKVISIFAMIIMLFSTSLTAFAGDVPEGLLSNDDAQVFFGEVLAYNDTTVTVCPRVKIKGDVLTGTQQHYDKPYPVGNFKVKPGNVYLFTYFDESQLSALETKFAHYLSAAEASSRNVAQEKDKIKALIADISHQTKTPIANLLLYSELLMEETLPASAKANVEALYKQSEKLRFLIDSLVKLSRLENGIISLAPQQASLQPLLESVVEQYAAKVSEKGLSLQLQDTDAFAVFDFKWTAEALANIVDNAIKYTDHGTIRISAVSYEMFARIDISDTGSGISESEQAKIFARFYRSNSVQKQEGVGIGLYLARQIISGEGGYIKVASVPGKGSTFSIFLPK